MQHYKLPITWMQTIAWNIWYLPQFPATICNHKRCFFFPSLLSDIFPAAVTIWKISCFTRSMYPLLTIALRMYFSITKVRAFLLSGRELSPRKNLLKVMDVYFIMCHCRAVPCFCINGLKQPRNYLSINIPCTNKHLLFVLSVLQWIYCSLF